jgi:carbonic anhydrase/acetyltransferase-like protein (isoleucine patch superfamily)
MVPAGCLRYPRAVIRVLPGMAPEIDPEAFVHAAAEVIGRVRIGARSSVWPQAVLRGDTDLVTVGAESNVQDGAVLHADVGVPCVVGDRVSIGHLACVHGCTVEDEVLIGIGAIVLNGARIGARSVVGAGAVVAEGVRIPPGSLVLGIPGRVARPTTAGQRERLLGTARHYVGLARMHRDA